MTLELARVQRLSEVVSEKRQTLTGHRLMPPNTASWPPEASSSALFSELVTAMYIWFHEAWGDEVGYLIEVARRLAVSSPEVRKFDGLIIDLRTSQQHSPNRESVRRSKSWYREVVGSETPATEGQWDRCGTELVVSCKSALSELVAIVNAVAADASAATEWSVRIAAATAHDPMAQLSVVVADLGVHVSPGQRGHLERAIGHDWGRRRSALTSIDDLEEQLANTVERVVVGWAMNSLPCPYEDVLEASDARPGREAIGALELAHAVADLVDFDSATDFLDYFARIWSAVDAARPSS